MVSAPLPACDPEALQRRLYDEDRIEVLAQLWNDRPLLRVSFQGYNDEADLDRLVEALARHLSGGACVLTALPSAHGFIRSRDRPWST
jgi:selenocysteine lyase/cysteine desulfurase